MANARTVTMADGRKVFFYEKFKRRAAREYAEALYEGARYGRNADGELELDFLPPQNLDKAAEAALPHLITKIEDKDGKAIEVDDWKGWMDELDEGDFVALVKVVSDMKKAADGRRMKSVKRSGSNGKETK